MNLEDRGRIKDSTYEGLGVALAASMILLMAYGWGRVTAYQDGYSQGYSDSKAGIPHLYRKDVGNDRL